MAQSTGSRRRFLSWAVTAGGITAAGLAHVARRFWGRGAEATHHAEPLVMPPLYPGPRIGEPGYSERVVMLFRRPDLPAEPSSY